MTFDDSVVTVSLSATNPFGKWMCIDGTKNKADYDEFARKRQMASLLGLQVGQKGRDCIVSLTRICKDTEVVQTLNHMRSEIERVVNIVNTVKGVQDA